MIRRPRRSTLFPYTTLSRSLSRPTQSPPYQAPISIQGANTIGGTLGPDHGRRSSAADIARITVRDAIEYRRRDRKSTRLNSSHGYISYAVFCLKKKNDTARLPRPHVPAGFQAAGLVPLLQPFLSFVRVFRRNPFL